MSYLDYQATTALAPEVSAAMVATMDHYGNPNSAHRAGRIEAAEVELAREPIAAALRTEGGRLIFTSVEP